MEVLYSFIGGLALAGLIAWLIARSIIRSRVAVASRTARMEAESALGVEKARLETELSHANARAEEIKAAGAQALEETKASAAKALDEAKAEAAKRQEEALEASDKAHKEAMGALQQRFDETIAKVTAQLKAETGEMLKDRQKEFSESSNLQLGQLVNPLKENIAELRKAMEQDSKEQAERSGEMRQHIRSLMERSDAAKKSADELAAALKHGTKLQGDWGETVLEELLTSQGLTRGVHFDTQAVIYGPDGKPVRSEDGSGGVLRPDVILHLDDHREVIIDSKVSMTAYIDYVNAESEPDRAAALKAHLDSLKKHVRELAAKDYTSYVKPPKVTAGYVIMFVPIAGALWEALREEPELWRKAADANVYIADEQTLYAALRMVSLTWTQIVQAENHEKVYELAREMIDRVGMFMEKYDGLGKALQKAADEYEDGRKKLSPQGQSILGTAGKLIRLGARNSDKHPIRSLTEGSSPE